MPPKTCLDPESTCSGNEASGPPTLTDDASPSIPPFEDESIVLDTTIHAPHDRKVGFGLILILGALNAVGALGIDTYLPAFPAIAKAFRVDDGKVQLSLAVYFIAAAVGQTVYGPLSDRYGRRLPLIAGLALFTLSSIGAALSTSIEMLIVMRFLMGFGACSAWVVTRAVVRDLSHGEGAARLFALMMLVLGVSPILAPQLGSVIIAHAPWPVLFWTLALFSVVLLVAVALVLPETHDPLRRSSGGIAPIFRTYGRLIRDRAFLVPTLVGGLSQSVLFAYLAASPFLYMKHHGVSPEAYGGLFALNAVGLIGLAQVNAPLLRRFGAGKLSRFATAVQTAGALTLAGLIFAGVDGLVPTVLCLVIAVGMQGLIGPTTMMLALEPHPEAAGSASALSGTVGFAFGALTGSLLGAFGGTERPFGFLIAICAFAALVASQFLPRGLRKESVAD